MKLTTTLNLLHKAEACTARYKVLRAALGVDYPMDAEISLRTILETNGINDALWALRATAEDCKKVARLMSADFAELSLPFWMKYYYPDDNRPALAIKAARDFAAGLITKEDLAVARSAARSAAESAARYATWSAAWSAAWSAQAEVFKCYVTI